MSYQILLFIVAVLATWRATLLITDSSEEGPFELFAIVRDRIDPEQKTWIGRGIRCVWCVSWWAGLVCALWIWGFAGIQDWMIPLWWFGVSGGVIALHNWSTRRR